MFHHFFFFFTFQIPVILNHFSLVYKQSYQYFFSKLLPRLSFVLFFFTFFFFFSFPNQTFLPRLSYLINSHTNNLSQFLNLLSITNHHNKKSKDHIRIFARERWCMWGLCRARVQCHSLSYERSDIILTHTKKTMRQFIICQLFYLQCKPTSLLHIVKKSLPYLCLLTECEHDRFIPR